MRSNTPQSRVCSIIYTQTFHGLTRCGFCGVRLCGDTFPIRNSCPTGGAGIRLPLGANGAPRRPGKGVHDAPTPRACAENRAARAKLSTTTVTGGTAVNGLPLYRLT